MSFRNAVTPKLDTEHTPVPCIVAPCAHVAATGYALVQHINAAHRAALRTDSAYHCPFAACAAATAQYTNFETHLNRHLGLAPHRCPHLASAPHPTHPDKIRRTQCAFRTPDPAALSVHRRAHADYAPPPRAPRRGARHPARAGAVFRHELGYRPEEEAADVRGKRKRTERDAPAEKCARRETGALPDWPMLDPPTSLPSPSPTPASPSAPAAQPPVFLLLAASPLAPPTRAEPAPPDALAAYAARGPPPRRRTPHAPPPSAARLWPWNPAHEMPGVYNAARPEWEGESGAALAPGLAGDGASVARYLERFARAAQEEGAVGAEELRGVAAACGASTLAADGAACAASAAPAASAPSAYSAAAAACPAGAAPAAYPCYSSSAAPAAAASAGQYGGYEGRAAPRAAFAASSSSLAGWNGVPAARGRAATASYCGVAQATGATYQSCASQKSSPNTSLPPNARTYPAYGSDAAQLPPTPAAGTQRVSDDAAVHHTSGASCSGAPAPTDVRPAARACHGPAPRPSPSPAPHTAAFPHAPSAPPTPALSRSSTRSPSPSSPPPPRTPRDPTPAQQLATSARGLWRAIAARDTFYVGAYTLTPLGWGATARRTRLAPCAVFPDVLIRSEETFADVLRAKGLGVGEGDGEGVGGEWDSEVLSAGDFACTFVLAEGLEDALEAHRCEARGCELCAAP